MDGPPYRLYRLESVPESRELPPGRYLIRNERRVRPEFEIDLSSPVPASRLGDLVNVASQDITR